jgi:uncharacterized protein YbbC (DUF1343 family)/CubicO group peptidase (beta-lactamase class C family)
MKSVALFVSFLLSVPALAQIDGVRLGWIDPAVRSAIQKANCPGAVVVVVHDDKVVYRKAYGHRQLVPEKIPMTLETVFDLASLTKPLATGTCAMLLIELGHLRLSDPIAKHWPAFAANGKESVTVEHCLLHTSGLIPDNSIKDYVGTHEEMMARVAALKLESPPGARFRYSDVGFIALGEVVKKITGLSVAQFADNVVFSQLKMKGTGYKPDPKLPFAITGIRDGKIISGAVHDPRAFALGGVAGHAGLFGTADDLARYARMLLRGGELDGVRILSPLGVKLFTEPRPVPGGLRSPGWDIDTSYSAPRGDLFPPGTGYGHTGFTGTSLWIDPPSKTAIVILTNRLHPDEKKGNVTELRRQIATIVAGAITKDGERVFTERTSLSKPVLTGSDVLVRDKFALLKGKNVGLVTNHTGRASDGTPLVDLLAKAEGVKLVALFSPEHGIRGEKDEKVGDGKDEKTGLPVYSLYGERRKPTAETLKGIDTIVYDIQDIGCRFYTYPSTLGLCLEVAKEHNLKVVVLDRPNPIGGVLVEGPVRDPGRGSFVGFHELPLRHGLTIGELATLFNAERNIGANLEVVKCENWRRGDTLDRTGLPWRNPSPNMRHLTAAMLYPGVGLLETTNISVGRGTERPFEWIGAPWIDSRKLAQELNAQRIPGVRFVPVNRTPVSSVHKDKDCGGVDIIVDEWKALRPVHAGLTIATVLRKAYAKEWDPKRFDTLLIHKATFDGVLAGKSVAELEKVWQPDLAIYRERRAKLLLYED